MSSINLGSSIEKNETSFWSIKSAVRYVLGTSALPAALGAAALFLANVPIALATQGNVTEFHPWEAGFNMGNRTGYDSGYGIGYDSGYDSGYGIGYARCLTNMSRESNNSSVFGVNILSIAACVAVVAIPKLIRAFPVSRRIFGVKENSIDKFRNSPQVLELQIKEIKESIGKKEFQDAKRFLNDILDSMKKEDQRLTARIGKNNNIIKSVVSTKESIDEIIALLGKKDKNAKNLLHKLNNSRLQYEIKGFIDSDKMDDAKKLLKAVLKEIIDKIAAVDFQKKADFSLRATYRSHISNIANIKEALDENCLKNALDYLAAMKRRNKLQIASKIKETTTQTIDTQTDFQPDDDVATLRRKIDGLNKEIKSLEEHFNEQQNTLLTAKGLVREARGGAGEGRRRNLNRLPPDRTSSSSSSAPTEIDDEKLKRVFARLDSNEKRVLSEILTKVPPKQRIEMKNDWSQISEEELLAGLKAQVKQIIESSKK